MGWRQLWTVFAFTLLFRSYLHKYLLQSGLDNNFHPITGLKISRPSKRIRSYQFRYFAPHLTQRSPSRKRARESFRSPRFKGCESI